MPPRVVNRLSRDAFRDVEAKSMSERVLQDNVLRLAERLGGRSAHLRPARVGERRDGSTRWVTAMSGAGCKGFPDLVLLREDRLLWRELKTERGRVTVEQRAWLDELVAAGQDAGIWRPSHWLAGTVERNLIG